MVDSSVWIANLRKLDTDAVRKLEAAVRSRETVLVGDLIMVEVLQGARDDADAGQIEQLLKRFKVVSLITEGMPARAARNYRLLRSHGVTIRKTVDLIIGTFCIDHGHTLLHQDRDFDGMARHLGLRVA